MRELLQHLHNAILPKQPLRRMLLLGFVLPLITSVGLVEYLAWKQEERAIAELVMQLQQGVGDRIEEHLSQLTQTPPNATAIIARALQRGDLDPTNLEDWAPYLYDQGQQFDALTFLYFGNDLGDYVELHQPLNRTDKVLYRSAQAPDRLQQLSPTGDRIQQEQRTQSFDPRQQPWYRSGAQGSPTWTGIYEPYLEWADSSVFHARKAAGLSFVRPYYSQDGNFLGVLGADFTLSAFSRFLNRLEIGKSGEAFLLDRDGTLLASSFAESPVGSDNRLLKVQEATNNLIQVTSQFLTEEFGNFQNITQSQSLRFQKSNQRDLVQVTPFGDDFGLDLLIVVVVPESDFTGAIRADIRYTFLLSATIIGLAVALTTVIARRLGVDVVRLSQASEAIAQGRLDQHIPRSSVVELDQVATAFNRMSRELQNSYHQLEDYSHSLETKVRERTQALERSEQRYRSFFEDAPIALWEEDFSEIKFYLDDLQKSKNIHHLPTYLENHLEEVEVCIQKIKVVDVNQAAVELFGANSKEQLIKRLSNSHPSDLLEGFLQELLTLINGSTGFKQEMVGYTLHGERKEFLLQGFVTTGCETDWSRVLIAISDITLQKQAEAEIFRAKEAAVVANRIKSEFLANMSHELRSPLNAILGFSNLMGRSPCLAAKQRENAMMISRSGEYLLNLINDVLDMSKIEAGRMNLNLMEFELPRLLEEIRDLFQIEANRKQLQLRWELASDLPQYLYSDPSKLRQILTNLLSNAIKFTDSGSITLRAQISESSKSFTATSSTTTSFTENSFTETSELTLQFQIQDTGWGIAPEELQQVFEPFVQTQTGQKSQQGTGLGLPISLKFAQLMGGDLSLSSQPRIQEQTQGGAAQNPSPSGTTATLTIRTTPVTTQQAQTVTAPRQVIGLEPGQPIFRILVTDDKHENRQLLGQILEPLGFEIQMASTGQEAIHRCFDWQPHLIWMDLRMPGTNGFEATRQIRAQSGRLPFPPKIIALTAQGITQEKTATLESDFDGLLHKPFDPSAIFTLMAEQIGVRYLYADVATSPPTPVISTTNAETGTEEISTTWTMAAMQRLPPLLLEQLEDATQRIDWERLFQLIAEIRQDEAELAEYLSTTVQNFEYSTLRQQLRTAQTAEMQK